MTYGSETERVNFDTECRNVLLLELSSQVTLNEGGLGVNQELASMSYLLLLPASARRVWTDSAFRSSLQSGSPAAACRRHPNPSKE